MKQLRLFLIFVLTILGSFLITNWSFAQDTDVPGDKPVITPVPLIIFEKPQPSLVPNTTLKPGVKSPKVKQLREVLNFLGYPSVPTNESEIFDEELQKFLKTFQQDNGLPVTGNFDKPTRKTLKKRIESITKNITKDQPVVDTTVDITCMQQVVEDRENELSDAWNTYLQEISAARQNRKTELSENWSIQNPGERYNKIKKTWLEYRTTVNETKSKFRQKREKIWNEFYQKAKNCNPSAIETRDLEPVETP